MYHLRQFASLPFAVLSILLVIVAASLAWVGGKIAGEDWITVDDLDLPK